MIDAASDTASARGVLKPELSLRWILILWHGTICGWRVGFRKAVIEAMWAIMRCRTGALGTRIQECPEHGEEVLFNSCRRRDCPGCVGNRSFCWAAMVERRLLACEHFHIVFTMSDKFLPYWRHNRALMADWLFEAATQTVKKLLADPKHMGGIPAIVGVLHTHGSALTLHPHVHLLVSSVGLAPDGTVVRVKKPGRLLPYKVIRKHYKMAFMHIFAKRSAGKDFYLPKGTTGPELRAFVTELFELPRRFWNVQVFLRADPVPVVRYLSRTVYGGPIRNHRLVAVDAHDVTFLYVDWRDRDETSSASPPERKLRLDLDTFVQRWSEHVPDPGQKTVRYWGLLAPGAQAALDCVREQLGQRPTPAKEPDSAASGDGEAVVRCRLCGAPMTVRELPPTSPVLARNASAILHTRASPLLRFLE